MIICHCNAITIDRFEAAAAEALRDTPAQLVTPEHVFARCGAAPNCGSCREMIRIIIDDLVDELTC